MPNTDNLIQLGTIVGVDTANRALVRVQIDDRVTDWIPYAMKASKHIKIWIPPQIGEQVEVHSPYGEGDDGVAHGSIYNKECKEPTGANSHTSIIEWSNGARVEVDTQASTMKLENPGDITLKSTSKIILDAPIVQLPNGDLIVDGTITDEKGSVTSHFHTDVMPGTANSGDRP